MNKTVRKVCERKWFFLLKRESPFPHTKTKRRGVGGFILPLTRTSVSIRSSVRGEVLRGDETPRHPLLQPPGSNTTGKRGWRTTVSRRLSCRSSLCARNPKKEKPSGSRANGHPHGSKTGTETKNASRLPQTKNFRNLDMSVERKSFVELRIKTYMVVSTTHGVSFITSSILEVNCLFCSIQ